MAVYRVFGKRLVPAEEIAFRNNEIQDAIASNGKVAFSSGTMNAASLVMPKDDPVGFHEVGSGKPLTVELRHVYTGVFPKTFLGSADMLVTTSTKSLDVFDAASRAVNFIHPKVKSRGNFNTPAASEQGTPIVCYVPAVTAISTTLTVELSFHRFPDDFLNEVANTFSSAAGIPLFLAASPFLIGAGILIKLAAKVGDALFDGKPDFAASIPINFSNPGEPVQQAGFRVIFDTTVDPSVDPTTLTFEPQQGLIDPKTHKPYAGDAPYYVVSIDGTAQDSLKSFSPAAASSAVLAKFLNVQDGGQVALGAVVDAVKALSDLKYRQAADAIERKIKDSHTDPASLPALKDQLKALVANIQNAELQPTDKGDA